MRPRAGDDTSGASAARDVEAVSSDRDEDAEQAGPSSEYS